MRLRQVALVARDLDPVVGDLCAVLGVQVGYRDPAIQVFGLHNAVMPVGNEFLEVVSPTRAGTTAGRLLERRGGDGGYMVIVQTDQDLSAAQERMERLGVRVVWQHAQRFDSAAGPVDMATIHLHPRDVGGAILSLDVADPPEAWAWAGPDWRMAVRREVVTGLAAVEIQSEDPAGSARRWSEVLARPAAERGEGGHEIVLDAGSIRFVHARDGRGAGVSKVELAAAHPERALELASRRGLDTDGDSVEVGGVRLSFA